MDSFSNEVISANMLISLGTSSQVNNSAVLEICLPNEAVVIKRPFQDSNVANSASDILANGIQSVVLDPAPECVAKLLSLAVDHIDTLLEDW